MRRSHCDLARFDFWAGVSAQYKSITCLILLALGILAGSCRARAEGTPESTKPQAATSLAFRGGTTWTGDLDGMLQRRYLRALVAYSKTQFYVVNGVPHGSSYEFLKAFEDEINRKHPYKQKNIRFHVFFVPVPRDKMLSLLQEGRGDLAVGALTITPQRLQTVDFTEPSVAGVQEIVVTGKNSPVLHSLDDLSGQDVFVRKSSSYYEHLQELNKKFKDRGRPEVKLRVAPEDLEDEDLLEMLNAGLVPIVVTDNYFPAIWQSVFKNIQPHRDIILHDGGTIGWAMRKNSPQLMASANDYIKTHKMGTAFGNTVLRRYFANSTMLKNAVSPAAQNAFQQTASLFQKYGGTYSVDYLLMMAQGFQESGLNQNAKSSVGAIGIMQLMPATGEQMKVGDIHKIDANVHAGIKYIRFMVNKYFANEPMSETDKVLFAFASYNAGPGRIRTLRAEAAKRGLDPNVWINNVEMVAAERIGTETVTYVSNIYKYYVAYKLLQELSSEKGKAIEQLAPKKQ